MWMTVTPDDNELEIQWGHFKGPHGDPYRVKKASVLACSAQVRRILDKLSAWYVSPQSVTQETGEDLCCASWSNEATSYDARCLMPKKIAFPALLCRVGSPVALLPATTNSLSRPIPTLTSHGDWSGTVGQASLGQAALANLTSRISGATSLFCLRFSITALTQRKPCRATLSASCRYLTSRHFSPFRT